MNWLVTGGCGFIGTRLIEGLRRNGTSAIRVLDNLSVGTVADLQAVTPVHIVGEPGAFPSMADPVELVVGDIRDRDLVSVATAGATIVVHLAASTGVIPSIENPVDDCMANVVGTLIMLDACRHHGVERFVFASSGAPLGAQLPPIHEGKLPKPVSPYGASKLAGEAYCHVYHAAFGMKTVALRFGNVYGPGSIHKGSVIAKFIKQVLEGETLVVYGDGTQTRDFIHVDDLVDAIVAASRYDGGGDVFQIATGSETTVNEILDALARVLNERGIVLHHRYTDPRVGEVVRNYADVRKARDVLGWTARHDLESGIRQTVTWFFDRGIATETGGV